MGGDIGEIKLGSERELYKYINHYVVVKFLLTLFPKHIYIKVVDARGKFSGETMYHVISHPLRTS